MIRFRDRAHLIEKDDPRIVAAVAQAARQAKRRDLRTCQIDEGNQNENAASARHWVVAFGGLGNGRAA